MSQKKVILGLCEEDQTSCTSETQTGSLKNTLEHQHWTVHDLNSIIWHCESKTDISRCDGCTYMYGKIAHRNLKAKLNQQ